jgi:hypothetical protein
MTTMELNDEYLYQQQRAALGMTPDNDRHQQTLRSLLAPPKALRVSAAEQRIVEQVRREWEEKQEFERLALLQHKCNKLEFYNL